MLVKIIVCLFAGLGAGFGTGFAGMSAAAVISPMLITFLGVPAYQAIGIALASDVLASAVSAYTYGKHKNLDIRNGIVMMAAVLIFTLIGSYISSLVPNHAMGNASVFLTMLLGIKFIVRPVLTTKDAQESKTMRQKLVQSILSGIVVGFICGFIGAGGGMMMLLLLTSVLGYELKTAVGTSVFTLYRVYLPVCPNRRRFRKQSRSKTFKPVDRRYSVSAGSCYASRKVGSIFTEIFLDFTPVLYYNEVNNCKNRRQTT